MVSKLPDRERLLTGVSKSRRNCRLSAVKREFLKLSWRIDHKEIIADTVDRTIALSLSGDWRAVRASEAHCVACTWQEETSNIQGNCDMSTPHHAALLMKIWGGAVMKRTFRHKMHKEVTPECECGCAWQDTRHWLYEYPFIDRPHFVWQAWSEHPPYISSELFLDAAASASMQKDWHIMCNHALSVFGFLKIKQNM